MGSGVLHGLVRFNLKLQSAVRFVVEHRGTRPTKERFLDSMSANKTFYA